jgi:chromosomal replication initiation ATPase DnaA
MTTALSRWRGWIEAPAPRAILSAADIVQAIADAHGLTLADLKAATRREAVSHPRQEAMAALRAETRADGRPRFSHAWIARFFGLKDHATVIHGVRAHAARRMQTGARP